MANIFISDKLYKTLTNKELIKKQQELELKLSRARTMTCIPKDVIYDMTTLINIIDDEINKRLNNGDMDEDELDEDY